MNDNNDLRNDTTTIEINKNDVIRYYIVELVREINSNNPFVAREITANILNDIFSNYEEGNEWVSILYRLIFHTCKQNPTMACYILCGFIQFTQTHQGYDYKPMLDYFIIKAFDGLLDIVGWSIIKPCIISLDNSFHNVYSEPLFNYILYKIVIQLRYDINVFPYYISDICHHLPREKSFVWGWFSHYIAKSYYSSPNNRLNNTITKKQMRKYLMFYRKTITNFRKMVPCVERHIECDKMMKEEWNDIINVLNDNKYQWASDIIYPYLPSNKFVYSVPLDNTNDDNDNDNDNDKDKDNNILIDEFGKEVINTLMTQEQQPEPEPEQQPEPVQPESVQPEPVQPEPVQPEPVQPEPEQQPESPVKVEAPIPIEIKKTEINNSWSSWFGWS